MKKTNKMWKVIALVLAIILAMPSISVAFAEEVTAAYGDINVDEQVNAQDALIALKSAAKIEELDDTQKFLADVNGDTSVDAKDALLILQKAAKIIDKFPVEEVEVTETPENTEVVTDAPVETDTPVPTETESDAPVETATPAPTETESDAPVETATPAPTESDDKLVLENAFTINVKDAGNVADVDETKITFKDPTGNDNGVLLENMFIGKDTSNGAAISFFLTSAIDVKPAVSNYTSIISVVNAEYTQILKYDLEGTRQLATNPTPKLNHWAASLNMNTGSEYFITLVAGTDGIHFYINGVNIGRGEYGQLDETKGRSDAMAIFSKEGSELYLGGTVNVLDAYKDMCKNKVPAGTIVRDIVGYVGTVTDDDVKEWYEAFTKGTVVIPSPEPTEAPVETDTPVSEAPVVTETPEPTTEVPVESVVAMEVKQDNGVATIEDGVITFVETTSTNGVLMANPFANKELTNGGSISFWYTPSVATKAAGLITVVNYTDLLQFARFNDDGTMQFRDAYSTQIYNVWSVDTKFEAGTSYFMTAVLSNEGIKYYANGEPIIITETSGNPGLKNEDQIAQAIVPLITNPNTNFYFGGTTDIWEKMVAHTGHALPAGLEIKDAKAHMSALTAEEVKALYEAALSTPDEPDTPVENEKLIANLEVKDEKYASFWSIDSDLQIGDLVFGDRDRTFVSIDASLIGSEYIVTACDSKNTTTDLAVVTAGKDMILSVGFDKRLANIPEWAADFTKTELTCVNDRDVVFVIYQKELKAGESVTLGAQGQSSGVVAYVAMATAK